MLPWAASSSSCDWDRHGETAIRWSRGRCTGNGALSALLDQHGALVARPRGARGDPEGGAQERRDRRVVTLALYGGSRHRDRLAAASLPDPALARAGPLRSGQPATRLLH